MTEKYGDKLKQEMNGPMYEVFARIMRVMINKKITVPGSFKKYAEFKLGVDYDCHRSVITV